MSHRIFRYGLLLSMLLSLGALKARFDADLGPATRDGDYYYTIARSLHDGEGLRSNLSLYLQGFQTFPHPVTQGPVWPLVLAGAGRVIGLRDAATAVPNAIYFLDLLLLYAVARRIQAGVGAGRKGWLFRQDGVFDLGHAAVVLLGANAVFFRFSSVPNTEAMAFFWVLCSLLALHEAATRGRVGAAAASGLLAGLAILTRTQAIAMAIAVPLVLTAVALADRRSGRLVPASLIGMALPFVPWVLHLSTWLDDVSFGHVIGQSTLHETPQLPVFEHTVILPTTWEWLQDRLSGVWLSIEPFGEASYTRHFGLAVYVIPAALVVLAYTLARSRPDASRGLPARLALPVACALAGAGMLLPVHLLHMAFDTPWLFGTRHGLPLVFMLVPALALLDAYGSRVVRATSAALLVASFVSGAAATKKMSDYGTKNGLGENGLALVEWLDDHRTPVSAVTTRPWSLGAFSRSGYHWILCQTDPKITLDLLEHAGADYVLVYPNERGCNFISDLRHGPVKLVARFGKGGAQIRVHALRATEPEGKDPSASTRSSRFAAGAEHRGQLSRSR